MFSFTKKSYEILEKNVYLDNMRRKYPDNYMIVTNGHADSGYRQGNIIAILTEDEYRQLTLPENLAPRFSILRGVNILQKERENYLGFIT